MANTAHYIAASTERNPVIVIRDDRGAEVVELELPPSATEPERAEEELRAAGWARSADWTTDAEGWIAPVMPA